MRKGGGTVTGLAGFLVGYLRSLRYRGTTKARTPPTPHWPLHAGIPRLGWAVYLLGWRDRERQRRRSSNHLCY